MINKNDISMYVDKNREYEGGNTPKTFHVPTSNGKVMGKSGITNREGIDFGQQSKESLKKWGVPSYFITKLEPVLGVRGNDALDYESPLTEEESLEVSKHYLKYSDNQLSEMFDTYKEADPRIKAELLQLRTHNYRLGREVASVLNKPYKNQKKLVDDLIIAIKKTGKGNKNRIEKTINNLKGIYNE